MGDAGLAPVGDEGNPSPSPSPFPTSPTSTLFATGLPRSDTYSLSHWLETVRADPLLAHRSTPELPTDTDILVIGSGLTGALTAYSLLLSSSSSARSVTLLEAREFCSGATGRNAGHCKPDRWRGFSKYREKFGEAQALKILDNERKTWEGLVNFVKDNNVECELWVGKTLDVMMSDDVAATAARTFADFKAAGGDIHGIEVIDDPAEAERVSRVKGAKAVYAWDASTLHPWKLAAHITRLALDRGLNLQIWTPVTSLTPAPNGKWTAHTPRGALTAQKVVHATNAYAGVLLPETRGVIRPQPHMCNKVHPPPSHSAAQHLANSYAVLYPSGMYSINPRLHTPGYSSYSSGGGVLFGGAAPNQHKLLEWLDEDVTGRRRMDDGLRDFGPVSEAVEKLGREGFGWDAEGDDGKGERTGNARYDGAWSGITGRSADMVPFIGAVPGKEGQWMCAGHNGHGMARIFSCAPALAKMIDGASWSDAGLPECFQVTQERLDRLREGLLKSAARS